MPDTSTNPAAWIPGQARDDGEWVRRPRYTFQHPIRRSATVQRPYSLTVIVPFIVGWTRQKYGNDPAFVT